LPALLCFAGCFGRWPETSIGGSGPWRGFVCSPCGAVCDATGLTARHVLVRRADVERERSENARRRPRSRPRLLTGTTQRLEGDTQPVTAAFWSFCPPCLALGSRTTTGLAFDARTPRPNAHARDLLLTAGLLARGSLPSVAFPGLDVPVDFLTKDSPLTVAGAAAALDESSSALRSLLIPNGEPSRTNYVELVLRVKFLCSARVFAPNNRANPTQAAERGRAPGPSSARDSPQAAGLPSGDDKIDCAASRRRQPDGPIPRRNTNE
jgi:hypothetical protein